MKPVLDLLILVSELATLACAIALVVVAVRFVFSRQRGRPGALS